MNQFWRFTPLKTLLWASLNQEKIVSGEERINTELLTTMMRSPSMQSTYLSLNPQVKSSFLCGLIEICVSEDCFDLVAALLAEKPYSAVFLCEMCHQEYFQDMQMQESLCRSFMDAIDNTTLYEVDQLAADSADAICDFIFKAKS